MILISASLLVTRNSWIRGERFLLVDITSESDGVFFDGLVEVFKLESGYACEAKVKADCCCLACVLKSPVKEENKDETAAKREINKNEMLMWVTQQTHDTPVYMSMRDMFGHLPGL